MSLTEQEIWANAGSTAAMALAEIAQGFTCGEQPDSDQWNWYINKLSACVVDLQNTIEVVSEEGIYSNTMNAQYDVISGDFSDRWNVLDDTATGITLPNSGGSMEARFRIDHEALIDHAFDTVGRMRGKYLLHFEFDTDIRDTLFDTGNSIWVPIEFNFLPLNNSPTNKLDPPSDNLIYGQADGASSVIHRSDSVQVLPPFTEWYRGNTIPDINIFHTSVEARIEFISNGIDPFDAVPVVGDYMNLTISFGGGDPSNSNGSGSNSLDDFVKLRHIGKLKVPYLDAQDLAYGP